MSVLVPGHYRGVQREISELDAILNNVPTGDSAPVVAAVDRSAPVAMLMVSGYGGLGVHALLSIQRLFPGYYRNVVFLSVGVADSGHFKGRGEVDSLKASTEEELQRYATLARRLGLAAEYRFRMGTDVVLEAEQLCHDAQRRYPRGVFFLGKLVFAQERLWYRFLHTDTAFAIQRRLQFSGLPTIVLPIRMTLTVST